MKTLKYISVGLVLIISEISSAQVNTNINVNVNTDSAKIAEQKQQPPPPPPAPVVVQAPAPVQEPEPKKEVFHGVLGVRFMPTFSSIELRNSDNNTITGEFVLSYGYGALLGLNFNNHVGLQIEGIYNNLSQKYKDKDLERKIEISYLNFPVLLSLNTGRSNMVNLNIVAGPQFGINLGSKVTTTGSEGVDTVHAVLAVKQGDFGFAYGAGLDFALNKRRNVRFDIGFRGVYGLIDISDDSKTIETDQYYILQKAHIETYSAYAGFLLLF